MKQAPFRVFIDFDNTITRGDVLDGVIAMFAVDDKWIALEESWRSGRIGARACLEGQLRSVRASWPELGHLLDGVELDPGFGPLCRWLRRQGVELTIVSDSFDLFIARILRRRGIRGVPVYANRLKLAGGRLSPSFPYHNPGCPKCAHCKKTHFTPRRGDARKVIYVGDGRSDICPAREADIVFAKDGLRDYLGEAKIPCIPFESLGDVLKSLKQKLHGS